MTMLKPNLDDLIKIQLDDSSIVREHTLTGGQLGSSAVYCSKRGKIFVKVATFV
jgi:hypothetical protein